MSIHLYVKKPALTGGANVEISAYVNRRGAPFFDSNNRSLVELGMRCYQGEASQGQFVFDLTDAGPEAAFPLGHSLVTLTEDAPGFEAWLFRGRVASDEGARGAVVVDEEQEWSTTVDDGNVDLRGQAFTEAWVRPEETDVARLVALQLYTLNGTSSTATYHRDTCEIIVNTSHLAPNTNTVTMPAKKYPAGTQPQEVVQDCAEMSGKTYGVVIHHTGGSHLCLFYTVYDDHTTYLCPGSISDDITEWDPNDLTAPVWEPHWEQGPGTVFNMQTMLSGMVGLWGTENVVFEQNTPSVDNYDYWVEAYHDGKSTDATQAAARTSEILFTRLQTYVTHSVSIIVNADQVDMIGAGMSIAAKNAIMSIGYPTEYFTRRIAECRFEPRMDGRYWAHLKIERPHLAVAPGRGQVGPYPPVQSEPPIPAVTDWEWSFGSDGFADGGTYGEVNSASSSPWHPGYVHSHVIAPSVGNFSSTPRAAITPGTYDFSAQIARNDGTPYNPGGIHIKLYYHDGSGMHLLWTSGLVTAYGPTEVSSSVVFPAGTDSFVFEVPSNSSRIYHAALTHGGSTPGFVGTPVPPAATDSTGAVGTSPIYAPIDHQHPAQTAEVTPIADAGGYYEGADVEEALQEIGADAQGLLWKMPVRVATTGSGTLATSFENGDTIDGITLATGDRILIKDQASADNGIYVVAASGAPTRALDFDLGAEAEGAVVYVRDGTANGDKIFTVTNNGTVTIGATTILFSAITAVSTITVQENDSTVDAAVTTIDFRTALNVTSSPAGEANVSVDLGTGSTQAAAGDHTHGGAATITVQEEDVTVDAAASTVDFGPGFNVTSSPAGEANVDLDFGTAADTVAEGDHTHTGEDFTERVPTLLQSAKGSADTPDDEFPTSSLDAKWTVADGASGTIALLDSSGTGVYDLATRAGWLLLESGTASGDDIELRQDYTLPDGNCLVAYFSIPQDFEATPTNNEVWIGFGVNDNDTSEFSGTTAQTALIAYDTDNSTSTSWRVLPFHGDGTNFGGQAQGNGALSSGIFLRIDRVGLVYYLFFSHEGHSWNFLGSKTMASAANNVWLFMVTRATIVNRVVAACAWIRQGTALAIDPWTL